MIFLKEKPFFRPWKVPLSLENEQAEALLEKASQDHSIKEELKEHLLQKLKVLENIKEK